jgi:hypothetical protein
VVGISEGELVKRPQPDTEYCATEEDDAESNDNRKKQKKKNDKERGVTLNDH